MANKVGPKGQVVIEKEIRDKLGIGPGWWALQRIVDGRVEISFVPPEHRRSLKGILAPYVKAKVDADEDWHEITERAWEEAAREKVKSWEEQGI